MHKFLYHSLMFQATEETGTEEICETATASVTQTTVNFSAVLVLCCVKKKNYTKINSAAIKRVVTELVISSRFSKGISLI